MKTYKIVVKQGLSGIIKAENNEELYKKLSTEHYGVLPLRGNNIIKYTPDNVKEIIEETE